MISVRTETILTDGVTGISFVLYGLAAYYLVEQVLIAALLILILGALLIIPRVILKRGKKDRWDEYTQENYNKARKWTLGLVEIGLMMVGFIMFIYRLKITYGCSICFYIVGAAEVLKCILFILFDTGLLRKGRQ